MSDNGSEIWYIEYRDHAFHVGDPKEVVEKPYVLWVCGVIEFENEDFIAVRWYGSLNHKTIYPTEKTEIIQKPLITKKKKLMIMGEK